MPLVALCSLCIPEVIKFYWCVKCELAPFNLAHRVWAHLLIVWLNLCAAVQQSKQQRGTEGDCGELPGSVTYQDEREEPSHVCGSFS